MTTSQAAAQTRSEISRHCSRLQRAKKWQNASMWDILAEVKSFIRGMAKRAAKRPGGLGRR